MLKERSFIIIEVNYNSLSFRYFLNEPVPEVFVLLLMVRLSKVSVTCFNLNHSSTYLIVNSRSHRTESRMRDPLQLFHWVRVTPSPRNTRFTPVSI